MAKIRVPLNELPEYVRNVRAAIKLLPSQSRATVVALRGELGAGKTTFVQALAHDMGIAASVLSPTYVLMKKYPIEGDRLPSGALRRFKTLVHIDAYRLERPEEFSTLQPQEFLGDPSNLVVVEWPEKLGRLLPKPDITVTFSAQDANGAERYIEIT
ncbi:MAG: tRNA (adenosine(37)-N6)-threonylcarbamoyltransferase complex ATPase subunit type 1 TsaE [Patescibacteria group bacterium]